MTTSGIRISGFGINVRDLDRSVDFYTRILGLEATMTIDIGELHEVLVSDAAKAVSILLVHHDDREGDPDPGTGYEKIVFVTDDVAALYAAATGDGAESLQEPTMHDTAGVTIALVRDPDGYLLELIQT